MQPPTLMPPPDSSSKHGSPYPALLPRSHEPCTLAFHAFKKYPSKRGPIKEKIPSKNALKRALLKPLYVEYWPHNWTISLPTVQTHDQDDKHDLQLSLLVQQVQQ